ncbi:hypothetical protein HAX54_001643 [Datura stramonium]|uniref:F-box protein n=1 Tax=Datura stramonium TaxID=4076 RepID=A0ABS8T3D4_DATST|nr:hypothetical protein [Datura stramonium]
MDRGKRSGRSLAARNNKIYLDFKDIIREHALPFLPPNHFPKFRTYFRHLSPDSQPLLLSYPLMQTLVGYSDPLLRFLPEPVDIKSSSNGLLCCQGREGDKAYYMCNPVTQQWKKLPKSNANHGSDPAIVEDSWEIAGEICFGARKVMPKSGVYVNGVVYWMTTSSILAFDLTKDRSQLLQGYDTRGILGAFSGKLCKVNVIGSSIKLNILANAHSNTMQMGSQIRMWSEKQTVVLDSKIVGDVARDYSVLLC